MRPRSTAAPLTGLIVALAVALATTGCGAPAPRSVGSPEPAVTVAPDRTYPVGVRTLALSRGSRPLPVLLWYPAQGDDVAPGRFPLVLFSHGLHSLPELHAPLATRWAAAGFVVAAPAYPHTKRRAPRFNRDDVRRQPADAWHVINEVLRLDTVGDDPLAGHLDRSRIGAAGHSAGGFTTAGMFTTGHSSRLRAGIVIAAGALAGAAFAGPPAALLFVHGDADRTVTISRGRAGYEQVPWAKAFLTLPGQGHGEYLRPGRPGFEEVLRTTTDFLRATLYDDARARQRIPVEAYRPGLTRFEGTGPFTPPSPASSGGVGGGPGQPEGQNRSHAPPSYR